MLVLVSLLGLFVAFSIIAMRMEMILYLRTINTIRRYFRKQDKKLGRFFVLSTSDKFPPFHEPWSAVFWQIVLMGFVDGIILGLGINNLFRTDWWVGLLVAVVFFLSHLVVYRFFAAKREFEWEHNLTGYVGKFKVSLKDVSEMSGGWDRGGKT